MEAIDKLDNTDSLRRESASEPQEEENVVEEVQTARPRDEQPEAIPKDKDSIEKARKASVLVEERLEESRERARVTEAFAGRATTFDFYQGFYPT